MSETQLAGRCHRPLVDRFIDRLVGVTAVCLFGAASSVIAQSPEAQPRWIPSSQAPPGTLSHQLEEQRHDFFIELAAAGNIELVFFGTTEAEMWWWDDRGQAVWEREFGSLNAANFGSQGTQPKSLLWRMQNGELAGYAAKLIVLQAGMQQVVESNSADNVPSYAELLDEIRSRQPQARILLFAPLPRGRTLAAQRQWAAANAAAFARYVDDETVFYLDIGASFYLPDGSFNGQTWSDDFSNRGTQTAAFEIWAEQLQPWLDRFVR